MSADDWGTETLPSPAALGLTRLVHERDVESTMDVAHALAADGGDAGVLVLADHQRRGRGRGGKSWQSSDLGGLWMTLVERPADSRVVGVLALRLGLAIADALAPLVDAPLQLKWPNDVMAGDGKLVGILVEARWRNANIDWVAIGVGVNRRAPLSFPSAASVRSGVSRSALLTALVPALRAAVAKEGLLSDAECAAWHARDIARGRSIIAPRVGIVVGVSNDGALLVAPESGAPAESCYSGSMVFAESIVPLPS